MAAPSSGIGQLLASLVRGAALGGGIALVFISLHYALSLEKKR